VLIFNPAHLHIGRDAYIGHRIMLCGDTRTELDIEEGVWIGSDCYMTSRPFRNARTPDRVRSPNTSRPVHARPRSFRSPQASEI
jgi:hypothetical protein